ncbi:protein-disulfide reductase DsbD domain-containing protein [Salibaculum sp.]|uniref:protein-disulfide reductase DsbD domain-containing protein n=1 Tax=Salibaculum sp. TaxID=2855480 RepID=UPI002B46F31F|nr:protein-disulfide reductase DsbD domain-containing protein [Salibaculum sp.]HKL70056.1 protein-disulfide reductase DsbD domain-containing protein [Salibaculum sp.]
MIRFAASLPPILLAATPLWSDPVSDMVSVRALSGWRMEDGRHMAGLEITLAPGWKTYWRAPGDAGIPPLFDWSGSENIAGVAFHWPVPRVWWSNGMRSIVYSDRVVIPMEFDLAEGTGPARAVAQVQLGVCEDICVPVQVGFDAVLPEQGSRNPRIAAALLDLPRTAAEAGVETVRCGLEPESDGMAVTARIEMPPIGRQESVVIEAGRPDIWISQPETRRAGDVLIAQADMVQVEGGAFALDRSDIRITVFGGGTAVDIQGCGAD